MTAGTGVIHFEMPDKERIYSYECDYYIHAFQLWINLPRRDEMIKPLPLSTDATIHTRTPIFYPHFTLV